MVYDAGDTLEVLQDCNVNLVSSGHKHVPYAWRLENIFAVNAGTVCTLRLRGNVRPCYNVVEIGEDLVTVGASIPSTTRTSSSSSRPRPWPSRAARSRRRPPPGRVSGSPRGRRVGPRAGCLREGVRPCPWVASGGGSWRLRGCLSDPTSHLRRWPSSRAGLPAGGARHAGPPTSSATGWSAPSSSAARRSCASRRATRSWRSSTACRCAGRGRASPAAALVRGPPPATPSTPCCARRLRPSSLTFPTSRC